MQPPRMGSSCLPHTAKPWPRGCSSDKSGGDSAQWHRDTRRVPEQRVLGTIHRAKGS